jgi:hypothetical protein
MQYKAADSTIISIAICGWRLAPGIRDTIKIRMTIITVDSTVVTRDSEYELTVTAVAMLLSISCGETSKANSVIPRAGSVYQLIHIKEPSHTYRPYIKDQWDDCYCPTSVPYDPAPPNLAVEGN